MVKKGKGSLSKIKQTKEYHLIAQEQFYKGPIPPANRISKIYNPSKVAKASNR